MSSDRHTTDEQIRQYTVGEVRPLNAPVHIEKYDPRWPELYAQEERRIRGALGDAALRVEHTGSTAVLGLPAKPVIDILLVVADSSDEASYVPALNRAGYTLRIREPDWFEHRMFKGPDTACNLHVLSDGCPEIDRMLLFRDWLRAHPEDRDLYSRTKLELAQREWRHLQNYADAKSSVISEIMTRAQKAVRE